MQDETPTPRTIPLPFAVLIAGGALIVGLLLGRALGGSDESASIAVPVPTATAPTSPSAVTPTPSPGGTGSVSQGEASVALTGEVNSAVTFGTLGADAVWSPPPGEIALSWNGPGDQVLSLDGPSFTSQISTDATHTLTFTVNVDGAPITFRSAAGECTVTISPALLTQMGGTFLCTNLPSTDGATIVSGQGSFAATG